MAPSLGRKGGTGGGGGNGKMGWTDEERLGSSPDETPQRTVSQA